jgi:uncharacterized protein (TIGR00725 family)
MKKIIIGVMGPGEGATKKDQNNAYQLGKLIAQQGWVLLTGGRNVGVMQSAMAGAKSINGLTVGILPDQDLTKMSSLVDIPIITDLGNARNNLNVLSSDIIVACGIGLGTVSEIALALKNSKKVILLTDHELAIKFFQSLTKAHLFIANFPEEVLKIIKDFNDH